MASYFHSLKYIIVGLLLPGALHSTPLYDEPPHDNNLEVNSSYSYDAQDMNFLLQSITQYGYQIRTLVLEFNQSSDVHTKHLEKIINETEKTERTSLLVAFEEKPLQWFGLFLRLARRPIKGIFMNPFNEEIPTAYKQLFSTLNISSQTGLMQFEDEDSGPLTIENLRNAAIGTIYPGIITNSTAIRRGHINNLQESFPEFWVRRVGQWIFPASPSQNGT